MFCPNCGAEIEEGVKFCTHCGSRIVVPEPEPAAAPELSPEPPKAEPVVVPPVAPAMPAQKRPRLILALLLTALALGPFLNDLISVLRRMAQLMFDRVFFYEIAMYYGEVLLFVAALFLFLELAARYPKGKRPVLGGIALLCMVFFCVLNVAGSLTLSARALWRWPRIGLVICLIAVAVLLFVAALRAFMNKRFAVVGGIGAGFYVLYELIILIDNSASYFSRATSSPEILFSLIVPVLFDLFFGLALLIYTLRFRPKA